MADDIVKLLRTNADWILTYEPHGLAPCAYLDQDAAAEIERLRALIVGFATAHSNRQGGVGGGVETWNALARATDALLAEAERQEVARD